MDSEKMMRRVAKSVGLEVRRSRRAKDNQGGFALVEPRTQCIVHGSRFELTAH